MTQQLFAAETGTGSRVVVLIHGFGGFHGIWDQLASELASENRVIAYDLPGHGGSLAWPDAGPAKIAVRAILADLATRGIEKAHFVGHSMGGAIAVLAALSDPARIASLTLLAPGGFGEEIAGPLLRRFAAARSQAEIRDCLDAMSGPKFHPADDSVQALETVRSADGQSEKLIEIAAAITENDRQGVIPHEILAKLTMPVSVVWGTADSVLPFSQTEGLPSAFRLYPLQGVGHMLPEEAPETVLDIIRRTMG